MTSADRWLSRYRSGDRDAVWHEMGQIGARVRGPEHVDEAQAVCDEMARRARQNVEVIIDRLLEQGFVFHTNDGTKTPVTPHHPPGGRVDEVLGWLTRHVGAVPMTLVSWLRLVGDVWFVGTHPHWPGSSAADPLVIELEGAGHPDHPIVDHFAEELAAHEEERAAGATGLFVLPVAPDRLHKANVSGGSPYGFVLPDDRADGAFRAEVEMPFLSYLQGVFSRGGFTAETGTSPEESCVRRDLAADLLPL